MIYLIATIDPIGIYRERIKISRGSALVQQKRAAWRAVINAEVRIRKRLGRPEKSRISDLSVTGFRLRTHLIIEPDCEIWVTLPGLETRLAKAVWVREYEAGCVFEYPLHQAVVDHIARLHRVMAAPPVR